MDGYCRIATQGRKGKGKGSVDTKTPRLQTPRLPNCAAPQFRPAMLPARQVPMLTADALPSLSLRRTCRIFTSMALFMITAYEESGGLAGSCSNYDRPVLGNAARRASKPLQPYTAERCPGNLIRTATELRTRCKLTTSKQYGRRGHDRCRLTEASE